MASVTDLFNRADENPIASPWSIIIGTDIRITSNAVTSGNFSGAIQAAIYSAGVQAFNADQESSITISVIANFDYPIAIARGSSGGNCYYMSCDVANGSVYVGKLISGVDTNLGTIGSTTFAANDVFKLRVVTTGGNSVLSVYKNGTQIGSNYTDSSSPITSGQPGIAYAVGNTGVSRIDAWTGNDLVSTPVLSSPLPSGTLATPTTANISATTTKGTAGSNTLYAVWSTANGFSGVTPTQVKNGQNAAGSTSGVLSGNAAITTTTPSIAVSGLSANTLYYYAITQTDSSGNSNVVQGSFTTSAVTTSTSVNLRDNANAAIASTSVQWFLTSTWGGSVVASGTTSTNGSGALLLTGLSPAAGSYKLFYKLASDENFNGMRPVTLV